MKTCDSNVLGAVEDIGINGVIEELGIIIGNNIDDAIDKLIFTREEINTLRNLRRTSNNVEKMDLERFIRERNDLKERIKALKSDLKILEKIKLSGEPVGY
jgi:hypothetical protein